MKRRLKDDRQLPNLFSDESGAVMVEFVIVSPFLMTIMMAVMYFQDVTKFLCAVPQWNTVQTWRSVGQAETGLTESDNIGFLGFGGIDTLQNAIATLPLAAPSSSGSTGRGIATAIYASGLAVSPNGGEATPWGLLGMQDDNYYREKSFNPVALGGSSATIEYKNTTFLSPLLGAANSFVGNTNSTTDPLAQQPLTALQVRYTSKSSIMNDSFSVFSNTDAAQRIRRVDRFTTLRNPIYLFAYMMQTLISGGFGVFAEIPQILQDTGITPGGSGGSNGLSGLASILNLFEQAQPLRKVDKRINESAHDVNGQMDFKRSPMATKNRLQIVSNTNQRWQMIQ